MSKSNFKSRKEGEEAVIQKANSDPAFRRALLSDPRKTLAAALGFELPAGMKLTVVEESARQVYLVLPPLPNGELNTSELDAVAGGVSNPATASHDAKGAPTPSQSGDPHNPVSLPGGQVGGGQVGGG